MDFIRNPQIYDGKLFFLSARNIVVFCVEKFEYKLIVYSVFFFLVFNNVNYI